MEERKLNEKESLELIAQMIQNSKKNLQVGRGNQFILLGMAGCYYLLGRNGYAHVDKESNVELALVCYTRYRLAGDDVATEEGRKTCCNLYGQGTEICMDVYRKHWNARDIPNGYLC